MLIIIHMYSKRRRMHTTNCFNLFFNIDFQRSKGGPTSGIKAVYNYKNDNCYYTGSTKSKQ